MWSPQMKRSKWERNTLRHSKEEGKEERTPGPEHLLGTQISESPP